MARNRLFGGRLGLALALTALLWLGLAAGPARAQPSVFADALAAEDTGLGSRSQATGSGGGPAGRRRTATRFCQLNNTTSATRASAVTIQGTYCCMCQGSLSHRQAAPDPPAVKSIAGC